MLKVGHCLCKSHRWLQILLGSFVGEVLEGELVFLVQILVTKITQHVHWWVADKTRFTKQLMSDTENANTNSLNNTQNGTPLIFIVHVFIYKLYTIPRSWAVHCPLIGALLSPHKQRNLSSSKSFTQLVLASELQSTCVLHSRPFAVK